MRKECLVNSDSSISQALDVSLTIITDLEISLVYCQRYGYGYDFLCPCFINLRFSIIHSSGVG